MEHDKGGQSTSGTMVPVLRLGETGRVTGKKNGTPTWRPPVRDTAGKSSKFVFPERPGKRTRSNGEKEDEVQKA